MQALVQQSVTACMVVVVVVVGQGLLHSPWGGARCVRLAGMLAHTLRYRIILQTRDIKIQIILVCNI